jgi:tetratricopeptide (TPR) repeat protein
MKPLEALFQQGRYREVFDQSRGSSDPQVLLIQANAALELGEGKHAREVLEGLPPFAEVELEAMRLYQLGWACLLLGDRDTYRQHVHQAAQLHQGFPTLLHLAYTLSPSEAVGVLKEALARATNPREEAQAAMALARFLEPLGRLREGLSYARLAYLYAPDDPQVAIIYAVLALGAGEGVALEDLVGILEPIAREGEFVNRVWSLNLLADLYLVLGESQQALDAVEHNIGLVGKDHLSLICVVAVRVYLATGKAEKAMALIKAAQLTDLTFSQPQGHLQLALGLALYPRSEAKEAFEQAMRIYGQAVPLGTMIAQVYLAELQQEPLDQSTLNQLDEWSEHALGLYPPLLRAARKAGYQLRVLGSGRLEGSNGPITLSPRSLELMVLLVSRPRGWTREQLCEALYGDTRIRAFKSEMYRLKRLLNELIKPRPWRVVQPVVADFLEVRQCLDRGEIGAAVAAYKAPLLPQSQAPGIEELRRELEEDLRQAVLVSRDSDLMFALSNVLTDDLELLERLLEGLSSTDWRSPVTLSRVARLRKTYL